jgi:predicted nucleotidyltransferase
VRIAAFCRRHAICELRLFAFASRDDFRDDGDVDFLVEFEPGITAGLLGLPPQRELEPSGIVGGKATSGPPAT